ncbi:MAG: RNA polymerase sigma factor SigZ [Nitrospira sp.]|jgi:RNA polymerase sigma-70 factor (ECF subfamily)|nr:RNA polymerase sigma factor SigZ [Nitrospira sp.]MDH4244341.1 RNA polymerase sigma factor SigZ [Nitrospira sp.]MDH4356388.1 RNA polymerase sigma factor SigZ [Nitrospira sp.]MDH5318297.1 RNA polymerase sigma factor SigZ [Nitrospira sp.]
MTKTTEELWQQLHDSLRAFIAKRIDDQAHVDDILQEVFVRVHRQIDSVNDPHRVVSWIYQITRNAIIDHYRKPGRQREIPAGLSSELDVCDETTKKPEMLDPDEGEESRSELVGCLRPMIERLSPDYRKAITLVEIDGLTQQAAAKQMGLSLSGMKSRVQRGRKQLKQMLEDCCVIELDRRGGVANYQSRSNVENLCAKGERCGPADET